ncbi:hypothetical protein E2P81_ATG09606 [Venturia nashicola]|uniref:Ntf2-like protein n=1 Tax=Venturia nashicola TaxID=86259 RepID=A0A4Z1P8R9_9PEZI|nr:hypothetical protein E6O75_ATG09816 [Venturia nashicola]TLD25949.1 hypothetical protein E2P81_ATG09606 [Venturia nashicola]
MTSLKARYDAFLASPSTGALADNASINYIPTLVTVNEPTAILKHLATQRKLLTKKSERVLSTIASSDGLCVDVDTTIEFIAGGGAFLPGLDDNFLSDKVVHFPVIHIVQFDADHKIRQIRQYWDQGSLLKQVDVIGARAKNWPIRDGADQARLIANSATDEQQQSTAMSRPSTASSLEQSRSRGSMTSATNDPHASLSLFAPREPDTTERHTGPSIAPRSSAKPQSRDLAEILAGDDSPPTSGSAARNQSPRKINGGAPKGGAGSHYGPIRLFDENDNEIDQTTPDKKTNPKKYKHFEFGQGEEAGPQGKQHYNFKHQSQWTFADFVTPEKPNLKIRPHDMRTMAWEENVSKTKSPTKAKDSFLTQQQQVEKSPTFRPVVHAARPDAEPHFQFNDQNTPAADKTKYRSHAGGMGLYKDHVLGSDDEDTVKKPLATITNVNQQGRDKDFLDHYEFTDASPSTAKATKNTKPDENQAKVLKGMASSWDTYDESPNASSKKENVPISTGRGIKTSGDGMGGSKGTARRWGFGDDSDPEPEEVNPRRKNNISQSRKEEEQKSFWDF